MDNYLFTTLKRSYFNLRNVCYDDKYLKDVDKIDVETVDIDYLRSYIIDLIDFIYDYEMLRDKMEYLSADCNDIRKTDFVKALHLYNCAIRRKNKYQYLLDNPITIGNYKYPLYKYNALKLFKKIYKMGPCKLPILSSRIVCNFNNGEEFYKYKYRCDELIYDIYNLFTLDNSEIFKQCFNNILNNTEERHNVTGNVLDIFNGKKVYFQYYRIVLFIGDNIENKTKKICFYELKLNNGHIDVEPAKSEPNRLRLRGPTFTCPICMTDELTSGISIHQVTNRDGKIIHHKICVSCHDDGYHRTLNNCMLCRGELQKPKLIDYIPKKTDITIIDTTICVVNIDDD